jgi:acetyl esterase/lipase
MTGRVGRLTTIVVGLALTVSALAAEGAKMELLWPDGAPGAKGERVGDKPSLAVYPVPEDKATGVGVVICPGGGYGDLAMDHEGRQVAEWLNSIGVSAFLLTYRHAGTGYGHPAPLQDGQRAIRLVRSQASEWNVDPKRVGMLGFSAGGHLTSTVGTHFDLGNKDSADPVERESCRPDFMVLAYPVISFTEPFTHRGSLQNLLGSSPDKQLVESLSIERQVTAETPPTFLVHTNEDVAVPPENSVYFYLALRKAKVPAELHIYTKGEHGLGLGAPGEPFASWPKRCEEWMKAMGILRSK